MSDAEQNEVFTQMRIEVKQLKVAQEKDVAALNKLTDMRFENARLALELQAQEYARRLKELNGEKDEIKAILAQSITRNEFSGSWKELTIKITDLQSARDKSIGANSRASYIAAIAVLISAVTLAINIFH